MLLQLWPHLQMQLQRHVSILRGVTPGLFQRDLIKGELIFLPLPAISSKSDGFVFQPAIGQAIHIMSTRDAVEGVGFQHGVEGNTTQFNVVVGRDAAIVLQVFALLFSTLSSSNSGLSSSSTRSRGIWSGASR